MDEFLKALRRYLAGSGQVPEAQGSFVQDTVAPVTGLPERIVSEPDIRSRIQALAVGGASGMYQPGSQTAFVDPRFSGRVGEQVLSHELAHHLDENGQVPQALRNQMDEMFAELTKDETPVGRFLRASRIKKPDNYAKVSRAEHFATAFENAFDILREKPGNRDYLLRQAEAEVPGTALAYNYIQRQLGQ